MILRRKNLLAEGCDAICGVWRWVYLQNFGSASYHIAEGIKTGVMSIYLSHDPACLSK
jgi:hypothetical protein